MKQQVSPVALIGIVAVALLLLVIMFVKNTAPHPQEGTAPPPQFSSDGVALRRQNYLKNHGGQANAGAAAPNAGRASSASGE